MDSDDLDVFREIPTPLVRARRAHEAMPQLERIRNEAITEASLGTSAAAIGRELGVTRQAISAILSGGPGPERGFWAAADGYLTVAVGGKPEAAKDASGPLGTVVAMEDLAAVSAVRDAVSPLGIKIHEEVIPVDGTVDLNRAGLLVICGPRLSPIVRQVLPSDRSLAFIHGNHGWYLLDNKSGSIYSSPIDEGEAADIAYLGRLPRPDGLGTFLYIAGIHAAGALGAVHYLSESLEEMWQQVKTRRFSALIRCQFDSVTHQVISSERITPLYEQEQ